MGRRIATGAGFSGCGGSFYRGLGALQGVNDAAVRKVGVVVGQAVQLGAGIARGYRP